MRSERDRLGDVAASVAAIETAVSGMDRAAFLAAFAGDLQFADALCFRLIVIGEAIAAVLEAGGRDPSAGGIVAAHPEIDWVGYVAMRNIVTHQYFRRDATAVWLAIEDELPVLKRAVDRALDRPAVER